MGGSAAGNNSQLFDLMSQYGTEPAQPVDYKKAVEREMQRQMKAGAGVGGMHYDIFPIFQALGMGLTGSANRPVTNGGKGKNNFMPDSRNGIDSFNKKPAPKPNPMAWQFPEYTQTWAFTPPTPTPYINPPKFDPAKYGDPNSKKNR